MINTLASEQNIKNNLFNKGKFINVDEMRESSIKNKKRRKNRQKSIEICNNNDMKYKNK